MEYVIEEFIDNLCFFFQAEDGIRDVERSRGLGDVYKRQDSGVSIPHANTKTRHWILRKSPEGLPDSDNIYGDICSPP